MHTDIFSIKILVVEDFRSTRNMEVDSLKELGFTNILEADNAKSAIEIVCEEKEVALIISDWNMPGMSGYDFLLWLRSNQEFGQTPLIMATAQGEKKQAVRAIEGGANHFISKPFTSQELKAAIKKVFAKKADVKKADVKKLDIQERPIKKTISGKVCIDIAHIQITDHLILGVLEHLIDTDEVCPKYFELKTHCMLSWNSVQDSLEKEAVDGAFILAPLAMDLFNFGVPVRLVLMSHKNGSTCVRSSQSGNQPLHTLMKSGVLYLPHTVSVHHMLSHMFLSEMGLKLGPAGMEGADVFFEVVPPIKMPEFLIKNPESWGFMVAEPIGSIAVNKGISDFMFFSGELWENHPCCAVVMGEKFISTYPDAVYEFVSLLVQAGQFVKDHPEKAAKIAAEFLDPDKNLGLDIPILKNVLTRPSGIKTDDLFPVKEDMDIIQRYMKEKMGIGGIIDLEKFIDSRFARAAYESFPLENRKALIDHNASIISNPVKFIAKTLNNRILKNRTEAFEYSTNEDNLTGCEIFFDKSEDNNKRIVIRPAGNINDLTTKGFIDNIKELSKDKYPDQVKYSNYCFDLSKVYDIDSTGLSGLIIFGKIMSKKACLEIVNAKQNILNLFHMAHLDKLYLIHDPKDAGSICR